MAIPKIYKYGIEIMKPWSKEMYDFNDELRIYYERQIIELINTLETSEECQELAKIVNPYGYGPGLYEDVEYMKEDMRGNVQSEGNWWIKDVVSELVAKERIKPLIFKLAPEMSWTSLYDADEVMNFIGFESREEILMLRERYSNQEA